MSHTELCWGQLADTAAEEISPEVMGYQCLWVSHGGQHAVVVSQPETPMGQVPRQSVSYFFSNTWKFPLVEQKKRQGSGSRTGCLFSELCHFCLRCWATCPLECWLPNEDHISSSLTKLLETGSEQIVCQLPYELQGTQHRFVPLECGCQGEYWLPWLGQKILAQLVSLGCGSTSCSLGNLGTKTFNVTA